MPGSGGQVQLLTDATHAAAELARERAAGSIAGRSVAERRDVRSSWTDRERRSDTTRDCSERDSVLTLSRSRLGHFYCFAAFGQLRRHALALVARAVDGGDDDAARRSRSSGCRGRRPRLVSPGSTCSFHSLPCFE